MFKVTRTLPYILTTLAVSLAATVAAAASLSLGDRGPEVIRLQERLKLTADGKFGKDTEEAVKAFQTKNSLKADGKVGKSTLKLLYPDTGPRYGDRRSKAARRGHRQRR